MQRRESKSLPGSWEVRLSPRDISVIALVRDSIDNKEIAPRLGITRGTLACVLGRLYLGLPVTNRGELATWARQHLEALDGQWVEESLHPPDCACDRCENVRVAQRTDGGLPVDKPVDKVAAA